MRLKILVAIASCLLAAGVTADAADPRPLNILFFLADDCNADSLGVFGCPIPDITPNIDKLAGEGIAIRNAFSTVAVCTPVRAAMMTGLLPHRSGCEGFEPIRDDAVTVNERLHSAGYFISMFGKNGAYKPADKYHVSLEWLSERGNRNPPKVGEFVRESIAKARAEGRPFFCHINCADPHRPFFGTADEKRERAKYPDRYGNPSRVIGEDEVPLPKFLDEIPGVRTEVAQYFNCVKRMDDSVGAALQALGESGEAERTLVFVYTGDHGMAFPFSKSNAYLQSNRGGLLIRWPGVVKPGSEDDKHLVSTLDFTPTWLEALGLPPIDGIDGRSFVPILRGESQSGREHVFCYYYRTGGEAAYPMRAIHTLKDSYIWNAWSNGQTKYRAENMSGLSWKAMREAATADPEVRRRCEQYLFREPEEYFVRSDEGQRQNRIADPERQGRIGELRDLLQTHLSKTGDSLAPAFKKRDDAEFMAALRKKIQSETEEISRSKKAKKASRPSQTTPKQWHSSNDSEP